MTPYFPIYVTSLSFISSLPSFNANNVKNDIFDMFMHLCIYLMKCIHQNDTKSIGFCFTRNILLNQPIFAFFLQTCFLICCVLLFIVSSCRRGSVLFLFFLRPTFSASQTFSFYCFTFYFIF